MKYDILISKDLNDINYVKHILFKFSNEKNYLL